MEAVTVETRTVRLSISSRHYVASPKAPSLFDRVRPDPIAPIGARVIKNDPPYDPEDYPDDMAAAVQTLCANTGTVMPGASYAEGEFSESACLSCDDGECGDGEDDDAGAELREKLAELMQFLQAEPDEEDDDDSAIVMGTEATLARQILPDGKERFEISYLEDESMDNTVTTIRFEPSRPDEVIIYRSGSVMSTLVCEKGHRHISSYVTPIAPFEAAVYTKDCSGTIRFAEGGTISVDYIIEIRGMNIQQTRMTIEVR